MDARAQAISFNSDMADQRQGSTRAPSLAKDFIVYGYKYIENAESEIFPGWLVKYQSPNSYNYLGVDGQGIRYWDPSATQYRFWAFTGEGWSYNDKMLTLNNQPLRIGEMGIAATDLADDANLYASVVERKAPIDPSIVTLAFSHAYSQVSMYFYYEVMQPGVAELQIKNVTFTPVAAIGKADKIYDKGNIQVQYPVNASADGQEIISVIGNNNNTRPYLDFVVSTALNGEVGLGVSHAIQAEVPNHSTAPDPVLYKYYYTLPMGIQNPDFELSMDVSELNSQGNVIRSTKRSATIPAAYMQWKSNYAYRYFIKITESSLSLQYDVKIDPWHSGGSQNEEWKNW